MKNINHTNITRIKNITNKEGGEAYLDLEYKEFTLHFPDRMKNNILDTQTDELVILYQKINGKRYLTHLVQPIDNERIEESGRENFRFGRIVKNIAFTNEENKIPFDQTKLSNLDFRNRGWGNAVKLKSIIDTEDLEPFQIEIWNKFRPFFDNELNDNPKNYQEYFNDELETDFETQEGKLLFREHRIRERDSWITYKKKQNALKENKFYCEVCNFSFINILWTRIY